MRWILSAIILISCLDVYADSLSKAKLYLKAGFPEESKREIIRDVVFDAPDSQAAEGYFLLGLILVEESMVLIANSYVHFNASELAMQSYISRQIKSNRNKQLWLGIGSLLSGVSGALSRNSVSSNLSYMRADIMSGQNSAYEHRSQNLTMMTFETSLRLNDMRLQGLKKFSKGISIWKELQEKFPDSEFSHVSIEMTEKFNNEIVAMGALSMAIDLSSKRKEVEVDLEEPKQLERVIEMKNFSRMIKLYDKAIQNAPGTSYANMAYKMKMQILLGWKKISNSNRGTTIAIGLDKSKFGGKEARYNIYLPIFVETFNQLETEFPNDPELNLYRLKIVELYENIKDKNSQKIWLNKVLENSVEDDAYHKTAIKELQKLK